MSGPGKYDRRVTTAQLAIVIPAIAVVAVAGINAWWQARVNQQNLDAQQKLAVQARVASAYEDMLEMIGWQMEFVMVTKPIFTSGEQPQPPPEPENERKRRVQARIGVHGSPAVKAILERWSKKVNEFFAEAWLLDTMQNDRSMTRPSDLQAAYGVTLSEQWQKLEASRRNLHAIVRELEDEISSELRA